MRPERGRRDVTLGELLVAGAVAVSTAVIVLGAVQNLVVVGQLSLAVFALGAKPQADGAAQIWRRYSNCAPPITLMAPAFNEALTIVDSVRSLLNLQYPEFEVVVVNDGSTDATLEALISAFEMTPVRRAVEPATKSAPIRGVYAASSQPRLIVVDKANGGKADALNAAINLARSPLVCAIDADSLLESDALLRAVQPFIDDPERVIAVGGSIRIANGCRIDHGRVIDVRLPKSPLALLQTVEYLRAFLAARLALSRLEALTIISGAFGLFDRQALIDVDGFSHGTVGEDMEMVIKLHRLRRDAGKPYRIVFIPEPVCWTEAPETLAALGRQRQRWQRGALETFFKHADMLWKPRYGRVAGLGMGQVLVVDVLGPIVEVLGYCVIPIFCLAGLLSWSFFGAFLSVSVGFGMAVSVGGLALEEAQLRRVANARDLLVLFGVAVIENFGYRQLSNIWRVQGAWQFATGVKQWGTMTRKGFGARPPLSKAAEVTA